ncbi:Isochorismate synthase 2, partial [Monoraphidium neglectum]
MLSEWPCSSSAPCVGGGSGAAPRGAVTRAQRTSARSRSSIAAYDGSAGEHAATCPLAPGRRRHHFELSPAPPPSAAALNRRRLRSAARAGAPDRAGTALADAFDSNPGASSGAAEPSGDASTPPPRPAPALAPGPSAVAPPMALQPVTFTQTWVLPPQPSWQRAAAALRAAAAAALPQLAALSSGVVRWEVPLPRGCSASRWLRGQDAASHHQVYFAGRHSTAPETPKSALAEAAARGWSAAAGLGAAWLWRGDGGVPFGEEQLTGVQRMLSEAQPRIRVLGGTRFDSQQAPAPEWEPFGSFCFLLPQIEYLEAADCALLSLNMAWDARYQSAAPDPLCRAGEGPPTAAAAAARALSLLSSLAPPAPPS